MVLTTTTTTTTTTTLRVYFLSAIFVKQMANYMGFGLILESFWGAVENEDFLGNVQKPIVSTRKKRNFLLNAFLSFSTRLLWFRARSAFLIVREIIAFFADTTFVFAKCSL